jgi:repressor LexA
MLARLADKGLLSYANGATMLTEKSRAAGSESTVKIPLLGSVACGLPRLAEQVAEAMIQISTRIARPGHHYFLLRAIGTSMNKSGIQPDDLVLVRRQSVANEGEKVVALVDGEATIKHFHRQAGVIVLKPNSTDSTYRPIVLSEEFIVQGVVITILPGSVALGN